MSKPWGQLKMTEHLDEIEDQLEDKIPASDFDKCAGLASIKRLANLLHESVELNDIRLEAIKSGNNDFINWVNGEIHNVELLNLFRKRIGKIMMKYRYSEWWDPSYQEFRNFQ